ncbi:MAG TPA: heterodisulfide reductase-related iron-sulfur binding cluster [Chloroflexia bacterium]|nr:heterodisulfide reductase-related iron-sulfur binding cluster [Chloroflexia bacterium]
MSVEINRSHGSDGPIDLNQLADVNLPGFKYTEGPSYDDMTRCIHCGLCLQNCPTYRETGMETESPRGRLYLMRSFAEGKIAADNPNLHQHLNLCLQCRACESACPSGVRYGHLVEKTLDELYHHPEVLAKRRTPTENVLRWLVFRQLFPHPERWRVFGLGTRLYQKTGLRQLTKKLGLLRLPVWKKLGLGKLADLEELMPPISEPMFAPPAEGFVPARTEQRYRVALFSGCIMSVAFARVNEATVRVLTRNYSEVIVPRTQICCGALNIHNHDRDYGKEMARLNIDAFEQSEKEFGNFDAIIINAAGCGSTLKEYGELLSDDPAYAARAERFASKVQDISEFLAGIDFNRKMGPVEKRVTYQDACHLIHAQRIKNPPRTLLKAIPGLELVEMRDSDKCCGSAGIYNVTHYDMSMQILDHKMERVAETRAGCVVSANPGCHLQLQLGVKRSGLNESREEPVEVVHLVELLDEAYRNAEV